MKKLLTIITTAAIFLTACGQPEIAETPKIARFQEAKLVETINLNSFSPNIKISATGTIEAEETTIIQPEISGRITNLNVKVGDKVKENQILATLGNSLATDVSDIQNSSAQKGATISQEVEALTEYSTIQSMNLAQRNLQLSEEAYENAYQSIINAQEAYELQYNQATLAIDNAELSYDQTKKSYKNAPDTTKSQAKLQKNIADNQVEQAQTALDQLTQGYETQMDQLQYAFTVAATQYQNAETQIQSSYANLSIQRLQSQSQSNQAEQGAAIAKASSERKNLIAQSEGTVTKVNVKENNLVNPGQAIIEIQNLNSLVVKTYISPEDAALISVNDKVEVETSGEKTTGKIAYIGSTLDPITKKVEVKITLKTSNAITGTQAKIYFTPKTKSILIPLNSVSIVNEKHSVKLMKNGKIELREVTLGKLLNEYVEVLEGLTKDDEVITTTNTFLSEGDTVKTQ
jgi:HlyD family secretion protein